MANVEINDLTNKATGESTDEFEIQETGGGSTRKMPMSGIRITRSQITDFQDAYGYLYEDTGSPGTTITVTTLGTFYGWVSAASGGVDGTYVTADLADATGDNLAIGSGGDGDYLVNLNVSFSGSVSAVVEGFIFNTGVQTTIGFVRKLGTGGDVGSASAAGILALTNGDEISFRVTSDSNGDSVNVWQCQLSAVRIAT